MKAFVAVALLVACVAAQTTLDRKLNLGNLLVNRWDVNTYKNVPEMRSINYPTTVYPYDTTTFYTTLEELVRSPLFQQYYTIPLFRQHFVNPIFQRYLLSVEFQKYWTVPEFQTFFTNEVLFYKYIAPVVYTTTLDNVWTTNTRSNVWNKDIITPTTVWDVLGMRNNWMNKQYVPTTLNYNQYNKYPVDIDMAKVQYYNILDKLVLNKNVDELVPEVDDVKVVKQIVDPMTGEIKYVYGVNQIVGDKLVRNTVEKYMNTPRRDITKRFFYNTLNRDIVKDDLLRKVFPINREIIKDDLLRKVLPVDSMMTTDLLKKFITEIPVETMLNRDLVKEEILRKFFTEAPIDKLVNDKYFYNLPVDTMDKDVLKKIFYTLPVDTLVKENLLKKFLINKMPIDMIKDDELFQKFLINNQYPTMTKEELIKKYLNNPMTITKDDLITKEIFPTMVFGDRVTIPKTLEDKITEQKIVKDELIKKMTRENIMV